MLQENSNTTVVRIAVARLESTPRRPAFASTEVIPANSAEPPAMISQTIKLPLFSGRSPTPFPQCRLLLDLLYFVMTQKGTGPGRCGKMKRLVLFFEERSDIIMELQPVRDMQNNEKARQKIRATGYAGGRALDDGAP